MTTKQEELFLLKKKQELLEFEIKLEEKEKCKQNMTNEKMLQIIDTMLKSYYNKQVINVRNHINFIKWFHEKIRDFEQTQSHGIWDDQQKQRDFALSRDIIRKYEISVGEIIRMCNIINNDEITYRVKNEIEKILSIEFPEYNIIHLLTRIVKNQEKTIKVIQNSNK